MITKNDIHAFLAAEGIARDSTVLVHTSMRALGEVEGGCDGLIDAFTSYLTDGLFIVPTHTWSSIGKDRPVFDSRTERPCIGALPTVAAFRSRKRVERTSPTAITFRRFCRISPSKVRT